MSSNIWSIWYPEQPAISLIIWVLLLVLVLYAARKPAHQAMRAFTHALHRGFRLSARSILLLEQRLIQRNREVLLAYGRETTERRVDREFQRIEALVSRDLSGYPSLQRDLKEQITNIDEDYIQSGEVPPAPPTWLKAVESVAAIPENGSPIVAKILSDIHGTLKKSMDKSVGEYRKANKERHQLLKKMMPYWRSLGKILTNVEKKITSLEHRSNIIDQQMDQYEQILNKTEYAERMLTSSAMTHFVISGIVLAIATVGGLVNFTLISVPLTEMVGGTSKILGFPSHDVAALFIVTLEVTFGVFLMESVGVTRLFPIINILDDRKRRVIFIVTLTFLILLASIEASLAYMRDMLAADNMALKDLLLERVPTEQTGLSWIPSVGQMVMGFILPFALTFVAIAFESFIHSSRTVVGIVSVWCLRFMAYISRLIGNLFFNLGQILVSVYDLVIFLPLKIETMFRGQGRSDKSGKADEVEFISESKNKVITE